MKKIINGAFVIYVITATAACGQSGGGSSPTAAATLSDQPQGNYSVQKQLDPSDMTRYAVGCAVAGQYGATAQIDSRLKPGMVFDSSVSAMSTLPQPSLVSASFERTISSVTAQVLVENFLLKAVAGVPGIQPGATATETCTLGSDGSFPCTYNPNFSSSSSSAAPSCNLNVTASDPELKYWGTFTTAGGRAFSAFKFVDHITGELNCSGADAGPGAIDEISIVSNDVPAEGTALFCGGVLLFDAYSLKKSDGTIITRLILESTAIH